MTGEVAPLAAQEPLVERSFEAEPVSGTEERVLVAPDGSSGGDSHAFKGTIDDTERLTENVSED
jgi:hypothetical protein